MWSIGTLLLSLTTLHAIQSLAYINPIARRKHRSLLQRPNRHGAFTTHSKTTLHAAALDPNVVQGAVIALTGMIAGIALVAFTEGQGERAKTRGGNLSDNMTTRIAGSLMEDVEVSSVSDLGGLTSQLEKALRESGSIEEEGLVKVLAISDEEKMKKAEEADDGW